MEYEKRKFFKRLKEIELPFFGKILDIFLFINKVDLEKKFIEFTLKLPVNFPEFLEEILIFEIREEMKPFFKEISIKVEYFSDLNAFYTSLQ